MLTRRKIANRLSTLGVLPGNLVEDVWECDIFSTMADHINAHNTFRAENGFDLEPKFSNLSSQHRPLSEVLAHDVNYLRRSGQLPEKLVSNIHFFEMYAATQNSFFLKVPIVKSEAYAIIFSAAMICFVHSLFSKFNLLFSTTKTSECLPQHDNILQSSDYSDEALLAGIYNDLEVFYRRELIRKPITPFHYGDPYNYCEQAEGARRFILAHEIGHLAFLLEPDLIPIKKSEFCEVLNKTLSDPATWHDKSEGFEKIGGEAAKCAANWTEELGCDAFAMRTILQNYPESAIQGSVQFELENCLVGIMMLLVTFDLVETALGLKWSITHPPAHMRLTFIKTTIRESAIYKSNLPLRRVLDTNWKFLVLLKRMLASPNFNKSGGFADSLTFFNRLNEFGKGIMMTLTNASFGDPETKLHDHQF